MPNALVSIFDAVSGWLIAGVVNMTFLHPVVLCTILFLVAGASCAVLADVLVKDRRPRNSDPRSGWTASRRVR